MTSTSHDDDSDAPAYDAGPPAQLGFDAPREGGASEGEADGGAFEALYARLEDVARRLETGDLTLEQSVALYEEGMRLAEQCQALLTDVEQRIETLRQRANGE